MKQRLEGAETLASRRTEGYSLLSNAVEKFHFLDPFVSAAAARCT
jgi:hypothetical protein